MIEKLMVFSLMLFVACAKAVDVSAEEKVRIEVGVAGATHPSGEPVRLQITHINPDPRPLIIKRRRGPTKIDDYVIELRGPDQKPVQVTAYLQHWKMKKEKDGSDSTSFIFTEVEASENLTLDLLLNLYFDCTAVGEYNGLIGTTSITDSDGRPVTLSSSFRFVIGPPR